MTAESLKFIGKANHANGVDKRDYSFIAVAGVFI